MAGHITNLIVAVFLDTVTVFSVKLCLMEVLIELYPFTPLSMTLTLFQGNSGINSGVIFEGEKTFKKAYVMKKKKYTETAFLDFKGDNLHVSNTV